MLGFDIFNEWRLQTKVCSANVLFGILSILLSFILSCVFYCVLSAVLSRVLSDGVLFVFSQVFSLVS